MNRSSTSSETNNAKSTPPPVFNYAEAAKRPSGSKNGQPNSSPSKNSPQSSTTPKNALNASVQLPRAPPSETVPIQFGSINEPADSTSQHSSTKSGDFMTSVKSSELTFGTVPATDASSSPSWQPPPQPSPTQTQGSPSYHQNHGNRSYRHHHNYKQHSTPMGMAHSPQNGMPPYFVPQSYDGQRGYDQRSFQGYDGQRQYYAHYSGMPAMSYGGMGIPQAGNHSSPQHYVPPARSSKAIRIIDPVTKTEVKTEALASASSSASSSRDATPKADDKKDKDHKPTGSPAPVSKAIPIVDPAIKQREERERQEREEAERKAKEEAERKAKEEEERKAKEEEERKAKEEAERKAKEEEEARRKAEEEQRQREERERQEREEAERKAKEEAEKAKAEEEARKKAEEEKRQREEREKQECEEAERKAKEEAEKAKARQQEEEKTRKAEEAPKTEESANKESQLEVKTDIKPEEKSESKPEEKESKPPATPVRTIEDPSTIKYPPEVKAPFGTKDPVTGKIQYDPAFLMQFAPLCLETTEDLSEFRNISEEAERGGRPGMARRQTSERGRGARTPSSPMGMGMFKHGSRDGRMEMGKFAGGRPLGPRSGSGSHALPPAGSAPGSPGGMQREGSHGGRSRSGRGGKGRHPPKDQEKQEKQQQGGPTIPPEQVAPLEKSENRWIPLALRKQREEAQNTDGLMSDEMIMRKVKSLLNKLTWEKFDSISNQIWDYAKQSEKEKDGRALKIVIQLTFEKACDEAPFAPLWAQLCRKMYDSITDDIKDENILDAKGEPVAGVNLFRKYLLNRCQHDFERGWKSQIPKVENQEMLSDEYYAAVKAKRQGLGLVQFIGELFKRHMLTDRIMLSCLTRLCADPLECEDEETETMCKLVTTIGRDLDTSSRKNKDWLDTYFERMKEMKSSPNLSNRVKFMIDDVFDLRQNKWVPRRGNQPAPTTIAEVHEQAQKAKEAEAAALKRTTSSRGSLPPPPKVETRPDGWSTVGSSSPGSVTPKKDLSNFGKADRSKSRSGVLGPSGSPFASLARAGAKDKDEEDSNASGGSTNMFSALNDE